MMQAMIFAAGLGTRLKPLTDTMPKALVSVGGEPLLKRVIHNLSVAGVDRIVVNVHHFAQQIIDYLKENDNFGLDIRISDESAGLLETGGGIKHAAPLFAPDAPILIHNVDILSNVDLRRFYQRAGGLLKTDGLANVPADVPDASVEAMADAPDASVEATVDVPDALLLVSQRKTQRYLLFDDTMRLVGWTNIATGEVKSPYPDLDPKACRMYAFAGIHALSPRMIPLMNQFPDRFSIIDFYLQTCATHRIEGFAKDDLQLMDIGKLDTLAQAEEFLVKVKSPSQPSPSGRA